MEEEEEITGGATGTTTVDMSGIENKLESISKLLSDDDNNSLLENISKKLEEISTSLDSLANPTPEQILRDIVVKLYANSKFDEDKSAAQLADAAIEHSMILLGKLKALFEAESQS